MGELLLVVDDDLATRRVVKALLERQGYDVRVAVDALETLELMKTFHPRLILMDIQLPGMSGLDLTRYLKATAKTREMSIVAFSGCTPHEMEKIAIQAGCDGYICKPIAADELMQLVAKYLRGTQSKHPNHNGGCD